MKNHITSTSSRFARTAAAAGFVLAGLMAAVPAAQAAEPIVIAHRGASGYLPEHTLAGYELAVKMGADYIEPDLQFTRDGVLVAIHDDTLQRTTNVSTLFTARNGSYKVSDFTLAEIKTLTVKPTGTGANSYAGFTPLNADMRVPTFQEVIDLAKSQSAITGRTVGIYPEAKQADPAMENQILSTLVSNGYTTAANKVYVQSFSDVTLRSFDVKQKAQGVDVPLILLGIAVTLPDGSAMMGLTTGTTLSFADVASFADGIGLLINNTTYGITKSYIDAAHAAGLQVHGWTFAKQDPVLAAAEYKRYLEMGMDGVFSNYADMAVQGRDAYVAAIPEPSTYALMALGLVGIAVVKRKTMH